MDPRGHRGIRVLSAGHLELSGAVLFEDTATPILQTDASDYGIGGYLFMVTNGKVPNHERDECKQRDVPGWNDQGLCLDSKEYKTIDAQNIAAGQGDKHPVLIRAFVTAAPRVSFQDGDPSNAGNKYGPAGDKSSKYKSSRYSSDKDGKHNRGHRGQGGTTLHSHTLLHITCDCDDTDIDTMYRSTGKVGDKN